jgi:alanyl-tRNA synthetase
MKINELLENGRMQSPHISYEDTATKVIATLKSYNSAVYTKLAQNLERTEALEEEIKQLKEEVKQMRRDDVAALFAAEDAAKTRVIDTISFIFTMSKDPKAAETVKWSNVVEELEKHLTPELIAVLESIKKQFTTVQEPKPPKLSVKRKESIGESVSSAMRGYFDKFLKFIQSWGAGYDRKLDALKARVQSA